MKERRSSNASCHSEKINTVANTDFYAVKFSVFLSSFRMWSHFVDCVRRYMSSCSTEDQRSKFNKAVSHSMDTVHAICSSDSHQKGLVSTRFLHSLLKFTNMFSKFYINSHTLKLWGVLEFLLNVNCELDGTAQKLEVWRPWVLSPSEHSYSFYSEWPLNNEIYRQILNGEYIWILRGYGVST